MLKKCNIVLATIMFMLVLVGWGKKEVKLLDSSKLIDLNKAIELSKPGGNNGDSEEENETKSESIPNEADEESKGDDTSDQESIEVKKTIVIRIRDDKIYYTCGSNSRDNISLTQLENRIRLDYTSDTEVTLMDDFAESHVYKDVCGILYSLKKDIGLIYKEDQVVGGN